MTKEKQNQINRRRGEKLKSTSQKEGHKPDSLCTLQNPFKS